MNYIKHLNAIFQQFSKDSRLNPTHISLYMAMFQLWNHYHFPEIFYVNRQEVMELSKIGSKSTYHRCIKNLSNWNYLLYTPSHNPFRGSRVRMFDFGTSSKQEMYPSLTNIETTNGQELVSKNKPLQTLKNNRNGIKIKNFEILSEGNIKKHTTTIPFQDNLKTKQEKDYDEPL